MNQKIKDILSSVTVQFICALILGGLFIYAGIQKTWDQHGFAKILANYKMLPLWLVNLPAVILPWLEIISGCLLIIGIFKRTSAIILSGLLCIFIIAISINLIRGISFDCGCFSTVTTESGSDPIGLIFRDILMLIPGMIIIFLGKEKAKQIQ